MRATTSTLRPSAPAARRRRTPAAAPRAESDFGQGNSPPPAAIILGTGVGMMINAASFCAAYKIMPEMRILASIIEEVQSPAVHTAMAKLGTVLASSGDIFMLTICLLLIEIRRWLDE